MEFRKFLSCTKAYSTNEFLYGRPDMKLKPYRPSKSARKAVHFGGIIIVLLGTAVVPGAFELSRRIDPEMFADPLGNTASRRS
jgi:hypothetical protein